jgi:hypothetical protein
MIRHLDAAGPCQFGSELLICKVHQSNGVEIRRRPMISTRGAGVSSMGLDINPIFPIRLPNFVMVGMIGIGWSVLVR